MTKQTISDLLKQLRKTSALSANNVVGKLKEYNINISSKTLYGYESGLSMPNADAFVALCRIYGCNNIMDTFSNSVDDVLFTNSEWKIIEKYRDLDDFGRETVDIALDRETTRVQSLKERDSKIEELEYQLSTKKRVFAYYGKIAAAGKSYGFDDVIAGVKEYPESDENRNADYTIGVSGDSMEPTYYDGDIVFVQSTTELHIGDIGIFQKDNGVYIKEVGENGLISHNSSYRPMTNDGDIKCLGKVIGKAND